jgi:hypothetical protein
MYQNPGFRILKSGEPKKRDVCLMLHMVHNRLHHRRNAETVSKDLCVVAKAEIQGRLLLVSDCIAFAKKYMGLKLCMSLLVFRLFEFRSRQRDILFTSEL